MLPIICQCNNFKIFTYSICLFVSIISFFLMIFLNARKTEYAKVFTLNNCFFIILIPLLFVKTVTVINCLLTGKNLTSNGGSISICIFFAGILLLTICIKERVSFKNTFYFLFPFGLFSLIISKIGCLCSGCCYGIPFESIFSIKFPIDANCCAPQEIKLFPLQLVYIMVLSAALYVYLLLRKKAVTYKFTGYFITSIILFAIGIEFMNGVEDRFVFEILTVKQCILLGLLIISVFNLKITVRST